MKKARRLVVWAGLILVVLFVVLVLGRGKPRPAAPLPVPNGYDSFVQASSLLSLDGVDVTVLDQVALGQFVATNREALRLLRVGLTQQCAVPLDYGQTDYTHFSANLLSGLGDLKSLAQLLAAEGRLAELENRPAEAARSYVDCIRFGNELSRGGRLINRLVGIACEGIGYRPLLTLLPKISTEELAALATWIDKIRRASVPWDEVWRAERRFMSRVTGIPFASVITAPSLLPAKRKAQQKDSRIVAQLSLLAVELALRCHLAENGKPPVRLQELSPRLLKEIPPDPFSGKALIYRPQGANWLLYSIGPDRKDDGGSPVTRGATATVKVGLPFFSDTVPAGDVFYDTSW